MSHSGHGNLSARIDAQRFQLTTTGVVRNLRPDQLATVTVEGEVEDGDLVPETAEMATTFALAHEPLPCRAEPLLRFGQAESVPMAPWGPRGSEVSVRGIGALLEKTPTTSAVLLANHGLLCLGADPRATAQLVVAIEEAAEAELAASAIGGAVDFPADALRRVRESMERSRLRP